MMDITTVSGFSSAILHFYIFIILAFASVGKLGAFRHFKRSLIDGFKVPAPLAPAVARLVIAVEGSLAIALLALPQWHSISILLVFAMFTGFTIMVGAIVAQDKIVNCNCFGKDSSKITVFDLIRNLSLMAAAAGCYLLGPISVVEDIFGGMGSMGQMVMLLLIAASFALMLAVLFINLKHFYQMSLPVAQR